MVFFPVMKVFSTVVKRDQPLYLGQFLTAFEILDKLLTIA
tara:strand:- start:9 stop:128 length:120 start_codon:yes stop_codon:yes gene_type:complete